MAKEILFVTFLSKYCIFFVVMNFQNICLALDLNEKQALIATLEDWASELGRQGRHNVYDMENLKQALASLESYASEEMDFFKDKFERLATTSDVDMKASILHDLGNTLVISANSSNDVTSQWSGRPFNESNDQWSAPQLPVRPRYMRRKPTGELGAWWINQIDLCPDDYYCAISDLVFLSDGLIAFSDQENFEIRLFDIEGNFIRKFSTVPLKPKEMTHLMDYTVLVKVRLLTGSYAVLEFNLWTGKSRVLVELGHSSLERCDGHLSIVNNIMFIPCSQHVFLYHTNGSFIRQIISTSRFNTPITGFKSEEGVNVTVMRDVTIPGNFEGTHLPVLFNETFEPLCSLTGNYRNGAVGRDGIYTFSETTIRKFDYNCSSVGVFATRRRRRQRDYRTIAVFNNILVGIVNQYRRKQHNNLAMVYKIH